MFKSRITKVYFSESVPCDVRTIGLTPPCPDGVQSQKTKNIRPHTVYSYSTFWFMLWRMLITWITCSPLSLSLNSATRPDKGFLGVFIPLLIAFRIR